MKKSILLFIFSFCTFFMTQGQVMHSPHNLEFSFGLESFEAFSPQMSNNIFFDSGGFGGSFGGRILQAEQKDIIKWRTIASLNYKKLLDSGNYFGFLTSFGRSNWIDNKEELTFDNSGQLTPLEFQEKNEEGTIGLAYIYSFLLTKNSPNLQFFIGSEGSVYDNFADSSPLNTNSVGSARRNIFGIRIAAVPELMYLFPNSRVTASFRTKLPLLHFERSSREDRNSGINSFFGGFSVNSSFEALVIDRIRFEVGIGYFLEAQ